jgi:hypothetical protein
MNRIKEVLNEKEIKQTWLSEILGKSFKIVNAYACSGNIAGECKRFVGRRF